MAVIGMATTAAAYGQGKVNFSNYYSYTQTTGVTYADGPDAGLGVGPEISAILLWGASGATSGLTPVAGSATPFGLGVATGPGIFTTGAGWFTGPTLSINGGVAGNYAFRIEATGTDHGFTYFGFSPVVTGPTQATSTSPVPNLPLALYHGSFHVDVLLSPEPSILALTGMGAAALMLVRRRK